MLAMNSPELEILGITTVQGNVPVERGFSNAKYLVKKFDKDIPVHTGTPGTYDLERNEKRKWLGERKEMEQITPMLSQKKMNYLHLPLLPKLVSKTRERSN